LAERPGQMYYEIELGRTWCLLNDPRGPELLDAVLERVLAQADAPQAPTVLTSVLLLDCLRMEAPDSPRVDRMIRLARRWFPVIRAPRITSPSSVSSASYSAARRVANSLPLP